LRESAKDLGAKEQTCKYGIFEARGVEELVEVEKNKWYPNISLDEG
jgi:hypothetical protein